MFRLSALLFCIYFANATPFALVKPVAIESFEARIVNGEEANDGQFPWEVAIYGKSSLYPRFLCAGALISDEWVLTAGHCLDGIISATVYSGTTRLSSSNRTVTQAADLILHQYFEPTFYNNDIGLIKLATPVEFDEHTQPIALAEEELEANTTVTVSGWGQVKDGDLEPSSDVLNYIEVETIDTLVCQRYYGYQAVYPGCVCIQSGDPLKSPCLGDSGAPVVSNADTDPVHVAIFSFVNAYGCELPYPAGNTRTAYYRDWIKEKTGI